MHYSELLLFAHWRNEKEEFHEDSMENCVNKYNSRKNEIIANRKTLYPGEDVIELLDLADLNLNKPEHVADVLDCQGEQENDDNKAEEFEDDPVYESFGYMGNLNLKEGEAKELVEDFKYKETILPSNDDLKHLTRSWFWNR